MLPPRLMGLVEEAPGPASAGDRLIRVETAVEPQTPEMFLSRAGGAPRAFWGSGASWHAAIGEAATLHVDARKGDRGRFSKIGSKAAGLIRERLIVDEASTPTRFFGGFAFHPDPDPDDRWTAFGSARFTLPAIQLSHGPSGTRLVGTARVPDDWSRRESIDAAREALGVAVERIQAPPPPGPDTYQPPRPQDEDTRHAFTRAVEAALDRIRADAFRKVVLARTLDLEARSVPDPAVLLGNLRRGNPGTHVFLLEPEPGRAFLGAAPEVLASVRGTTFQASAVAGSIRRGDTEAEDDRLARELATSEKHRDEHAIVVRSMRDRLAGLTDHVEIGRQTSVLRLARIQHLERDLYARVGEDQHVLDLLSQLHPTPAVCGDPREPAQRFLRNEEPFERGWYAGPVGWFDARGDGTFVPALRSAVFADNTWRLFAGAGVVEGSKPEAEYAETGIKFEPILDALGAPRTELEVPGP